MSKKLEKTVRLQSEKAQEWIREARGERLQAIVESKRSAHCLVKRSAHCQSLPGRFGDPL